MSDIKSLINPPEEAGDTIMPSIVPIQPKREIAVKDEDKDYKEESDDATAHNHTGPAVSQDTILGSFDRIKTHFPAARIKKIMQSDEDIGKVAQATPVVVGRALEIFMANLVEAAIIETKSAGVRRIAASHVRAAVEKTEQFDFLVDVVLKYLSSKN
ncbi:hypothetical protein HF325_003846 [Metschnikowia pulcherrima]|uniref:Transcription factor CBF/NF-Y/archaeal histone domain-containing protein n=1 Tax=Metschnikowia pulcherrima TaxID=27326 RepID=A0A8H7GQM7_9ASCO|nr:hypothetical protein HF325_003846 [Metschnikowia pulcherrima]